MMDAVFTCAPRHKHALAGLLSVFFFLAPFYPHHTSPHFAFLFDSALYLLIALLALQLSWRGVLLQAARSPLFFPVLAGWVYFLAGMLYTADLYGAKHKFSLWLAVSFLYLIVSLFPWERGHRNGFLIALALSGFFAALHALYAQSVGNALLIETVRTSPIYDEGMRMEMIQTLEANRAIGRFGNPNHLAGYLVLALWGLWWMYQKTAFRLIQWGALAASLAISVAVYRTFSRSGLLVFLLSGFFFILYEGLKEKTGKQIRNRLLWIGGLAGIALLAFWMFLPAGFLGGRLWTTSTLVARLHYFRGAALIMNQHPFIGTGPESFEAFYGQWMRPGDLEAKYAHNLFLEAGVEGGIIGVFLLVWLLVALFQTGWVAWKAGKDRIGVYAAFGALASFLLLCMIDFHNRFIEMYLIPVVLLAGVSPRAEPPSRSSKMPIQGWGLGYAALVGAWWILVLFSYYNLTERELAYALILENRDAEARTCYRRAVFYDPLDADSWNGLARAWQRLPMPEAQQQALEYFGRAVEWAPRRASFRADFAGQLFALGYREKAVEQGMIAQRLFPSRPKHYRALADMYDAMGEAEKALEQRQTAQRLEEEIEKKKNG